MRLSRFCPLLVHALVLLWLVSCGTYKAEPGGMVPEWADLPSSPEELIQRSDEILQTTRALNQLTYAASCLEKAAQSELTYPVQWRLARIYQVLADRVERKSMQRKLLRKAVRIAEYAHQIDPRKPEALAVLASSRGVLATLALAPGKSIQESIEGPAEMLMENHPNYNGGEGRRILGALYAKAPPWPAGVGDLEEGLELLETNASLFPNFPMNRFLYGEALLRDSRAKEAKREFTAVLEANRDGEWGMIGAPYRRQARQYLRNLSESEGNTP